jgi:hypothetical protein
VHLSCTDSNVVYKWTKMRFHKTHVSSEASKTISKPMVWSVQTVHRSCTGSNVVYKWTEMRFHKTHVSSGASKTISKLMVCSAQTVQLSCIKISTISKQTEMSFHLSLITSEHHQVHLKRFLSLQYVRRKPCTYLAPTVTLSINGPK